jgi:anti-sigma B factor antagonist
MTTRVTVRTMQPVFPLSGEIDAATREADRDAAESFFASADGPVWVVDLTAVTFMDSSGLALLIKVRKEANSRGATVTLRGPSPTILKLLTITGLKALFAVEAS